jgi:DNA repair protein RadA/Sms
MPLGSDRPIAVFGEIGLTGELRPVAHHERRVSEAAKFGLAPVLAPGDGVTMLRQALTSALAQAAPAQAA